MNAAPRRNIELKAIDPDPALTLSRCITLGAADHGELWQRDTYFAARDGRLKLREQRPGRPHLIHYRRPDRADARESRYRIAEVADAASMIAQLGAALGTIGVVVKTRRLLIWRDVRIHLDRVDELGSFVELEAVAAPDSDLGLECERVARLRHVLRIDDRRLVASGYAQQLLGAAFRSSA